MPFSAEAGAARRDRHRPVPAGDTEIALLKNKAPPPVQPLPFRTAPSRTRDRAHAEKLSGPS